MLGSSESCAREFSRSISRNSGTQNYLAFFFLEIAIPRFVSRAMWQVFGETRLSASKNLRSCNFIKSKNVESCTQQCVKQQTGLEVTRCRTPFDGLLKALLSGASSVFVVGLR